MTLDQVSHTHPPCGVAHPLASRISSPRSFLPRLSFSPSLSEDPDLPEFSRRHQKRHGHLDVQSQISHALADESEDRLRRRRDYRYTPLVPRRKPLPPPVPLPRPPTPTRRRAPTPPPSLPRAPPPIPLQYRISALPLPSFTRRKPFSTARINFLTPLTTIDSLFSESATSSSGSSTTSTQTATRGRAASSRTSTGSVRSLGKSGSTV